MIITLIILVIVIFLVVLFGPDDFVPPTDYSNFD